uniref:Ig-like domain-containing protein n=1 Tax=Acanthochromis polyacanthus TaxID=80966 RepID=A0A3Q1EXJ9_9TELE
AQVSDVHAQTMIGVEKITADLGENVSLPCKAPNNNKTITAVEWSRPDQDPDYVLFYQDGYIHPHNQHPSYQHRVDLQDKELRDGNFSLILKNVTKEDTGRYKCYVYETGKTIELISIIDLEVHGEFVLRVQFVCHSAM